MFAAAILTNQLKKLSTFFYLLFFLFVLNIFFKLFYTWEGMSNIVRVYIFVFSFYMIFNFSQIKISPLRAEFTKAYGRWGIYLLFLVTRVTPYLMIYGISAIFTFIESIGGTGWPWKPLFALLYGKNTNHIFMSVLLLLVLKIKKDPKITIPFFLAFLTLHFIFYKTVYYMLPNGLVMTGVKIIEFILLLFFVFYEFFFYEGKAIKSLLVSVAIGFLAYGALIGTYCGLYYLTADASAPQVRSAQTLMKMGYSFPLPRMREYILRHGQVQLIEELLYYAQRNRREISFSPQQWEVILKGSGIKTTDAVARYLLERKVRISYGVVMACANKASLSAREDLPAARDFIRYAATYCKAHHNDIMERYARGNRAYRIWTIRVVAEARNPQIIPSLIDILTGIDTALAEEAYGALVRITGLDPGEALKLQVNNPRVISIFKDYYLLHTLPGSR